MKKSLSIITAVFFVAFGFISAFAQDAKPAPASGLLYKISGKNLQKPSYLYGTYHLLCQEDMFGMDKLNSYIDQTDRILMELDMDNPAEMQGMMAMMMLKDGKTIKDFLTAEEYAKVDELTKNYLNTPLDNLKNFHPFLINTMIITSPKALGCPAVGSYELSFIKEAAARQKSVEGLETVALQMEKINKKSIAEQAKDLYKMAQDPKKFVESEFKRMVTAYKSQDSDFIYKAMEGGLGFDEATKKAMLDERNIAWIPKIEKAMSEKPTFIAVGAGHLGGKSGVIKLLREKGYKVEAIKF